MSMTRPLPLVIAALAVAHVAGDEFEMSWDLAQTLLGSSIQDLGAHPDFAVREDPDWTDEDEATIYTQRWRVTNSDGRSFNVATDDGIVTSIELFNPDIPTERGIRVGDSLAKVKSAYPSARSHGGSETTLTTSLRLYAEDGNLSFTFADADLWRALRRGATFDVDDPRVRAVKVQWIFYAHGNRFACGEKFPCPDVPDWISDD